MAELGFKWFYIFVMHFFLQGGYVSGFIYLLYILFYRGPGEWLFIFVVYFVLHGAG